MRRVAASFEGENFRQNDFVKNSFSCGFDNSAQNAILSRSFERNDFLGEAP